MQSGSCSTAVLHKIPCFLHRKIGGSQDRVASKRVDLADISCTKNGNKGTFGCSSVPKTGTRAHSDVPLYQKPEGVHIRQNRPFASSGKNATFVGYVVALAIEVRRLCTHGLKLGSLVSHSEHS